MRTALALIAILPTLMPPGVCVCQFAPTRATQGSSKATVQSAARCDCCHHEDCDGDQGEDTGGPDEHRERGCPAAVCLAVVGQTLATPTGESNGFDEFVSAPVVVCLIADPVLFATPFDDGSPSSDDDVPLYTRLSRLTI